MFEELEARLAKVEAMEEIKNLQSKYVHFLDGSRVDEVLDLFVDDLVFEVAEDVGTLTSLGKFNSKTEVGELLRGAGGHHKMMCHQVMSSYIEVDGDKARGTWHLFGPFTAITPQGEVAYWIQGRYENEYIKVDGRWKFSHLKFIYNLSSPYEEGWVKTRMFHAE